MSQSNIQIGGQKHQDCQLTVIAQSAGAAVWINDENGAPIANLRLSAHDAKTLITRLAQALDPHVYGSAISTSRADRLA